MAQQQQPEPQLEQHQQQQHQQDQQPLQRQLSEATASRLLNSVILSHATPTTSTMPIDSSTLLMSSGAGTEVGTCDSTAGVGVSGGGGGGSVDGGSVDSGGIDSDCVDGGGGTGAAQLGRVLPTSGPGQASQESVHSANEAGNSCRICRWNRSGMEIISCPCKCKGSVGYVHLKCLKRWIMHRGENRCEVCNTPFNITADRASFKQMVRAFCCGRCCGMIVKHMLFSASLMPLAHVILQQVLHCMDSLNQGSTEQLTVQEVSVASCALLTSSALFFHFFEFVTTRFLLIRNILRHWWMFGSTNDFGNGEIEDDTFDLL